MRPVETRSNPPLPKPCKEHCDFEGAKLISRATWVCPDCGRDISIEYMFWAPAAHLEWFKEIENETKP